MPQEALTPAAPSVDTAVDPSAPLSAAPDSASAAQVPDVPAAFPAGVTRFFCLVRRKADQVEVLPLARLADGRFTTLSDRERLSRFTPDGRVRLDFVPPDRCRHGAFVILAFDPEKELRRPYMGLGPRHLNYKRLRLEERVASADELDVFLVVAPAAGEAERPGPEGWPSTMKVAPAGALEEAQKGVAVPREGARRRRLRHPHPVLVAALGRLYGPVRLTEDVADGSVAAEGLGADGVFEYVEAEHAHFFAASVPGAGPDVPARTLVFADLHGLERRREDVLTDDDLLERLARAVDDRAFEPNAFAQWMKGRRSGLEFFSADPAVRRERVKRLRAVLADDASRTAHYEALATILEALFVRTTAVEGPLFAALLERCAADPKIIRGLAVCREAREEVEARRLELARIEEAHRSAAAVEEAQAEEVRAARREEAERLESRLAALRAEIHCAGTIEDLEVRRREAETALDAAVRRRARVERDLRALETRRRSAAAGRGRPEAAGAGLPQKAPLPLPLSLPPAAPQEAASGVLAASDASETSETSDRRLPPACWRGAAVSPLAGRDLALALAERIRRAFPMTVEEALALLLAWGQRRFTILAGPAGCGKTTLVRGFAAALGIDAVGRLQSERTTPGWTTPETAFGGGGTLAPFLQDLAAEAAAGAAELPAWVVFDDAHLAPLEAWAGALLRADEGAAGEVELTPRGGRIPLAPACRFTAVMETGVDGTIPGLSAAAAERAAVVRVEQPAVLPTTLWSPAAPAGLEGGAAALGHLMRLLAPEGERLAHLIAAQPKDLHRAVDVEIYLGECGLMPSLRVRRDVRRFIAAGSAVFPGDPLEAGRKAADHALSQRVTPFLEAGAAADPARRGVFEELERRAKARGFLRFARDMHRLAEALQREAARYAF